MKALLLNSWAMEFWFILAIQNRSNATQKEPYSSGLAIIEAIQSLNETVGREKGVDLTVRIGVATGMVMVGEIVGEGTAQERTVIGEAPNLAARLQGVAGRNGLVIGGLTKELARDAFVYEDLGARDLKGISGQVQVWGVVGHSEDHITDSDDRDTDGAADVPRVDRSGRGGRTFTPSLGKHP